MLFMRVEWSAVRRLSGGYWKMQQARLTLPLSTQRLSEWLKTGYAAILAPASRVDRDTLEVLNAEIHSRDGSYFV